MLSRKINSPDWLKNRSLYEVNVRQYSASGTFIEFEEHLPRLKELGVGILWFMPIYPIGEKNRKGSLGSYYSIRDFKAINPEFGTLAEFKSMVKKIHELGIKVIIDWVANHTAWDHVWTKEHPDFYSKDKVGNFTPPFPDWEDVIHLDYNNPALWDEMIHAMEFWLKETDIDGFRCDMAHLVPTLFWNRARYELDKIKPVLMLAESENQDLLEYAFDLLYNWKLMHAMNDLASRKINADDLLKIALNEVNNLPKGASLLNFTSNHDENSWQGSAIERIHYFLEPLTALTFLIPGNPLIYSGQEAGNYRRLKFFDKDEIEWKDDKMTGLYQKLSFLKSSDQQSDGETTVHVIENDRPEAIVSLHRKSEDQQQLIFLNLSSKAIQFFIHCEDLNGSYTDTISNQKVEFSCKNQIFLEPFRFRILKMG